MREVHFHTLDLNLLRVFDALAEERSVTKAGERLGLTQSAVSHALNRLRYALEDELFLRGPDGMTPTPRATEIWPELRLGLDQLQHALTPTGFDPSQSERVFQVSASAYTGEVLMPRAIARIRAEAPKVQIQIRGQSSSVPEALEAGRLDLAIGVFGRISDIFTREILFEERLVWAVRADHPALGEADVLKALERQPLVFLAPPSNERSTSERSGRLVESQVIWDRLLSEPTPLGRGARQRIRVTVDNAHAALALISGSDMAGLVPRRLAMMHKTALDLELVEIPADRGQGSPMEAIWRTDQSNHPALAWLRGILRDAARET